MPLVTSKELLEKAREGHYAIGAFNANNMEMVQAIVAAAEAEGAPVILQVSQGAIRYAGLEYAAGIVKIAAQKATVPVVLHLDHGTSFAQNILCLQAGFTSLMYDGSKEPYEVNIATTRRIVEIAHICGLPVEGELGQVLQSADSPSREEVQEALTDPEQAAEFVAATGVDSLAIAVGSVHGMREQEARLDVERIAALRARVSVPLVLHGSSGVEEDSIRQAIQAGICKINVATHLNQAFTRAIRRSLAAMPEEVDPRNFLGAAREEVVEAVRERIRLFGSSGMARPAGAVQPFALGGTKFTKE